MLVTGLEDRLGILGDAMDKQKKQNDNRFGFCR